MAMVDKRGLESHTDPTITLTGKGNAETRDWLTLTLSHSVPMSCAIKFKIRKKKK